LNLNNKHHPTSSGSPTSSRIIAIVALARPTRRRSRIDASTKSTKSIPTHTHRACEPYTIDRHEWCQIDTSFIHSIGLSPIPTGLSTRRMMMMMMMNDHPRDDVVDDDQDTSSYK
jgi:hypothetical protein